MTLISPSSDSVGLALSSLKSGRKGISPAYGAALSEAASVCIANFNHSNPASMHVQDNANIILADIIWEEPSEQIVRTWADLEVATEQGAYCLAALLVEKYGLEVMQRSRKGTGFDFWLGPPDQELLLFQNLVRLEVSGILCGDDSSIAQRSRIKVEQTKRSDDTKIPAVIAVIEFSNPAARIIERCKL
ncbi:hypothetical protein [Luteolibacter luteus]|uniref:Uncharacterized protein n=1 Tax=Luteolibacter luteus TaxID=2728835 RepID=A0A858RQX0_9BACT|nr:hypothetical protein [Luteolibacter luteus]QJE98788.1 hypothetical protein HHL09_24410 [Luteolibacter luteus]